MVLGLLLREQEESRLVFDFESSLPNDNDVPMDDGMDTGPKDFKRGTVVCRHWLRGLCMKGDNCEFLHQYDMSKMPECRWGMECQVPECPFRHVPDEERVECAFYRQGFCSHGPNCRYRHIKLAREECPETADFSLQSKVAEEENAKRRKQTPQNEFYKIAICKHWEKMGSCPFNEECHFAHGESELRPFPKSGEPPSRGGAPSAMPVPQTAVQPSPVVLPDENKFCKYFILHSFSYLNLAMGIEHQQWTVPLEIRQVLKMASETCDEVFVCVTVTPSRHFQAIARLVRGTLINVDPSTTGEDLSTSIVPYNKDRSTEPEKGGELTWSGAFSLEWLRTCECPYERLAQFENQSIVIQETVNGQELETEVGHAIIRLLFHQPPIQLHLKSVEDEPTLPGGAEELAIRRREAAELSASSGTGASLWNVTMPGFVFACNNTTIDECFGRMIMGLAKDHEAIAMKSVVPGTPLFLINMSDRHVLGIFEAVTPPVVNMIPGAFSHGPNVPSPFPVQVRFHVALNGPATPDIDPQIQAIFGERGIRMGPLTLPVTQRLADVFAARCGPPPFGPSGPMGMGMPDGRPAGSSNGAIGPFIEKMLVGIEVENEFGVTRRIIGPAGSHMKRISQEAGGGAKIKVRGRGSGSKESTEDEANEPLMIIVSAENERSFRIACELTAQLLNNIHHDHHMFLQRLQQRSRGGVFTHPSIPSHGPAP